MSAFSAYLAFSVRPRYKSLPSSENFSVPFSMDLGCQSVLRICVSYSMSFCQSVTVTGMSLYQSVSVRGINPCQSGVLVRVSQGY